MANHKQPPVSALAAQKRSPELVVMHGIRRSPERGGGWEAVSFLADIANKEFRSDVKRLEPNVRAIAVGRIADELEVQE